MQIAEMMTKNKNKREITMNNTDKFLKELEKLSVKHGVVLGGRISLKTEDFVGVNYSLNKYGKVEKDVTYAAFQTVNEDELIILPTENEKWGFYGTRVSDSPKTAEKNWNTASTLLVKLSGKSPEIVRDFLDSKYGRWLADECHNSDLVEAINKAYNREYRKTLADWEVI
jgi:hypothetical protein